MDAIINIFLFSQEYPLVVEILLIFYCLYLRGIITKEIIEAKKFRNKTELRVDEIEDNRVRKIELFLNLYFNYYQKNGDS